MLSPIKRVIIAITLSATCQFVNLTGRYFFHTFHYVKLCSTIQFAQWPVRNGARNRETTGEGALRNTEAALADLQEFEERRAGRVSEDSTLMTHPAYSHTYLFGAAIK